MRRDATMTGRPRQGAEPIMSGALQRLRALPARGYAAAALTAVLVGIVVNALTLQHERHPAPFFAHASGLTPSPAPAPVAVQIAAPPAPEATPPARPVELGAEASAPVRGDAIGDMLRTDQERDAQKQVVAAQNALIRLGYVLKADGESSPTMTSALHEFERAHGLPLSSTLNPKLFKTLIAAADAAGH
jgi:hypothetical protein